MLLSPSAVADDRGDQFHRASVFASDPMVGRIWRSRWYVLLIGGCVEKSDASPPPWNGLTMYSGSVAG